MPVAQMKKINIIATASVKERILSTLKESELVELRSLAKIPQEEELKTILPERDLDYEYELAELKSAIDFLETYSEKKKGFIEKLYERYRGWWIHKRY